MSREEAIIVDDSRTQAEYLRGVLVEAGFDVRVAHHGARCLELCRERAPTVVLSDVVMPDIDGLELARTIRSDPELADVPVILLTAHHDPGLVVDALRAGAANYVSKPFVPEVLVERIRRTLAAHREGSSPTPLPSGPGLFATLRSALEDAANRTEELERSRASLALAVQQRDDLMAVVAHDLRTPLQVMLGHCTLAARDPGGPVAAGLGKVVEEQASTMVRLIDDLVDASQIEAGTLAVERKPVDLVQVVQATVAGYRHRWKDGEMRVEAPASLMIEADPRRMAQVLTNLLTNACKYSAPGRPIDVRVDGTEDEATLRVTDRGVGIAPADREAVFARNHRTRTESGSHRVQGWGCSSADGWWSCTAAASCWSRRRRRDRRSWCGSRGAPDLGTVPGTIFMVAIEGSGPYEWG
ncbi:MAG: hybrid sensor histidine kinase/response regulator [Myxococcota bacterium]